MAKIMLNGIDYSSPTTSGVSGVKGNSEMVYRAGNVNLTPENIGAVNILGDTMTGPLSTSSLRADEISGKSNPGIYLPSNIDPKYNNQYNLGYSSVRWKEIWSAVSVNTTSDRNLKQNIQNLDDEWVEFFMLLQPKSYLFKDGESGRTHVGFISQDVEEALESCGFTALDFAGFCKDQKTEKRETQDGMAEDVSVFDEDGNPVYIYSLRYEEFIALNTMMIQKQQNKIKELESRIDIIEKIVF